MDRAASTEVVPFGPQMTPEVRLGSSLKKPIFVFNYLQTNGVEQCPLTPQGKRNPAQKSVEKKTVIKYQRTSKEKVVGLKSED